MKGTSIRIPRAYIEGRRIGNAERHTEEHREGRTQGQKERDIPIYIPVARANGAPRVTGTEGVPMG